MSDTSTTTLATSGSRIATVDDVKTALGISGSTEDTRLSVFCDVVTALIQRLTNRELFYATRTEFYSGDGSRRLYLNEYPIVSVTSIYEANSAAGWPEDIMLDYGGEDRTSEWVVSGNLLTANTDFITAKNENCLLRLNYVWPEGVANIRVVYAGGYTTIPADLRQAAIDAVAELRSESLSGGVPVDAETLGDYSYRKAMSGRMGLSFSSVIATYRRVVI